MTRFIFVRVGAVLLIVAAAVLVARFFILQSLNCKPVCINVNLIGRDLRNIDLRKVNFTEANLQRSDLSGADLRWTDFSGARLSNALLANTDLRGAKLIGADLRSADLRGAKLSGADLSGAVLDRADLTQLDLTEARLWGVSFVGSKLVEANLSQLTLSGISFSSADLSGANLTDANLAGTSLSRANLSGAILVGTDIAGSWVNLANLTGADLTGADLTGADLSGTSLIGANLASARLSQARLIGANLVGALFLGTDLRSASLQGIRLVVSELTEQDYLDPELANLNELQRSALIVDANLRGVQYNAQTQWPSGKLVLLAGLLGQEFADAVAAQQVAEPTPEPTPTIEESAILSATVEVIGQPESTGPAISFAVSGSGTPLTQSLYDLFQAQGYTDTIGFRDVETNNAIALFCESSEVDAVLLARTMTTSELEACAAAGHELVSLQVGTTVLAVIVDPSNDFLTDLTFSEIPLLLTAEKWAQIRPEWPDELVMRFLTNPDSGPLSFASANFFAGSESDPIAVAPNTIFNPDEIQLVQAIATTPFAAGFFGLNHYTQNAEILKLVTIDGVTPTTETVASGVYTLTQPLMIYSDLAQIQEKPEIGYFLWFYLDTINTLIERAGFVVSSTEVMEANRAAINSIPSSGPSDTGESDPQEDPAGTPTPEAQGEPGATDPGATPTITTTSLITVTIIARLTATVTATVPITPVATQTPQPTGTPTSEATVTATVALTTPVAAEEVPESTGTPANGPTVTATVALTTPVAAEEVPEPTGTPTSP